MDIFTASRALNLLIPGGKLDTAFAATPSISELLFMLALVVFGLAIQELCHISRMAFFQRRFLAKWRMIRSTREVANCTAIPGHRLWWWRSYDPLTGACRTQLTLQLHCLSLQICPRFRRSNPLCRPIALLTMLDKHIYNCVSTNGCFRASRWASYNSHRTSLTCAPRLPLRLIRNTGCFTHLP